jgi:hypothetical protein
MRKAMSFIAPLAAGSALCACGASSDVAMADRGQAGPVRKAGLWAQTVILDNKASEAKVGLVCLDAAPISDVRVMGRRIGSADCQRSATRGAGGVYHFASACQVGGGAVVTTTGVATGDFASRYAVRAVVSLQGAPIAGLDGRHQMSLSGAYRGPCPAGMAPGDVADARGRKIRVGGPSGIPGLAAGL